MDKTQLEKLRKHRLSTQNPYCVLTPTYYYHCSNVQHFDRFNSAYLKVLSEVLEYNILIEERLKQMFNMNLSRFPSSLRNELLDFQVFHINTVKHVCRLKDMKKIYELENRLKVMYESTNSQIKTMALVFTKAGDTSIANRLKSLTIDFQIIYESKISTSKINSYVKFKEYRKTEIIK